MHKSFYDITSVAGRMVLAEMSSFEPSKRRDQSFKRNKLVPYIEYNSGQTYTRAHKLTWLFKVLPKLLIDGSAS